MRNETYIQLKNTLQELNKIKNRLEYVSMKIQDTCSHYHYDPGACEESCNLHQLDCMNCDNYEFRLDTELILRNQDDE